MIAAGRLVAAAVIACLPAGARTQEVPQDLISARYRCEGGASVPVVYVNASETGGYAVMLIDGRLVAMRQVASGSGARYRSGNGDDAYELWAKGDAATIRVGPDGGGRVILSDCRSR